MRARRGALCTASVGALALGMTAACSQDWSAPAAPESAAADAGHRGDTGPVGGPVLDAAVTCPSIGHLVDAFDELATARWTVFRDPALSVCTVAAEEGRLELASSDDTVACGLESTSCHNLSDRAVRIEVADAGADGLPEPFFRLQLKSGAALEMRVVAGEPLVLELSQEGEVLSDEEFDPEEQRFWRIVHTELAGRIDFQAAPTGTGEWSTIASADVKAEEMTEVQLLLGVSGAGGPEDLVAFDDLVGIDF